MKADYKPSWHNSVIYVKPVKGTLIQIYLFIFNYYYQSLCLLMETPHQRLSHTCHRQHAEANLLQFVQDEARWFLHMVFRTKISINKSNSAFHRCGIYRSFSTMSLENVILLIVLVLVHFPPHLGLFPAAFESHCQWQHFPELYSITLNGLF